MMMTLPTDMPLPQLFAYTGSRTSKERNGHGKGINVYRVEQGTGEWQHMQLVEDLVNPSFLIVSHDQRTLYTVHGDQAEVSAFAIDRQSGRLQLMNRVSTSGRNPVHLTVTPGGNFLLVANYATGSIATIRLHAGGSLTVMTDLTTISGAPGPHRSQQTAAHPHQVTFDPSGQHLFVPDKGLDKVFIYRFDAGKGCLDVFDKKAINARAGAGPRHMAFHPTQPFAYVMNELDSSVTLYRFMPDHANLIPLQRIATIPDTHVSDNTGAGIIISPSGKFLYSSNRGHDSIVTYSVEQDTGRLSPLSWDSSQGNCPRFICLDPTGKFLYVANENSHTIVQFNVNEASGKVTFAGNVIETGSPVSIAFASLAT